MASLERWESVAEERIRKAQASGEFTNLPGFGKPLRIIDEPYDEYWWVRRKLRQENLQGSISPSDLRNV